MNRFPPNGAKAKFGDEPAPSNALPVLSRNGCQRRRLTEEGCKITRLDEFGRKELDGKVLITRKDSQHRISGSEVKLSSDLP